MSPLTLPHIREIIAALCQAPHSDTYMIEVRSCSAAALSLPTDRSVTFMTPLHYYSYLKLFFITYLTLFLSVRNW